MSIRHGLLAPTVPVWAQWASRAARWAAVWALLAKMEEEGQRENLEVMCISTRIVEQTVEPAQSVGEDQPPEIAKHCASTEPDLAVFSGEDGSFGPEKSVVAVHRVTAAFTTVAKSVGVGEARPSEFAKYSSTTAVTVAKSPDVGKARTPEIAKYRATTDCELAETCGGAGPSWSRAHGTTNVKVTGVVKSAGEARPPGFEKYSATSDSESDLAESFDEEASDEAEPSSRKVCW